MTTESILTQAGAAIEAEAQARIKKAENLKLKWLEDRDGRRLKAMQQAEKDIKKLKQCVAAFESELAVTRTEWADAQGRADRATKEADRHRGLAAQYKRRIDRLEKQPAVS